MTKKIKTNALRKLDQQRMSYEIFIYDAGGGIDGITVAAKIGEPVETVYKTLVTHSGQELFVFVIPVAAELDLKKAAAAVGVKKLELLPVKELLSKTGYIRGGCSPVGMKKQYATVIDTSAEGLAAIIVSAGQIGIQMKIAVTSLLTVVNGTLKDVIKR